MSAVRQPFQAFLDDHRQAVLSFLRAMVGPQDAEDVFQETFLAALRAYDRLDARQPRAWILTIARRKAIDHHRARARGPEPRAELPEPRTAGADRLSAPAASIPGLPDAGAGVGAEGVWSAVARLSAAQRAAIGLRFAADLSHAQIASALGCSEAAARRRVHDGLRALRATIDAEVDR